MSSLWRWYNAMLKRRPVPTQMVTSTILWSAGDASAQLVERYQRTLDEKKGLSLLIADGAKVGSHIPSLFSPTEDLRVMYRTWIPMHFLLM
jgi:hypothetical protein